MRQRWLGNRNINQLRGLVLEEVLSKGGFEVLSGLLTCDPGMRLTAASPITWTSSTVMTIVLSPQLLQFRLA
nr:unnamed protein product [Digitaria exilis]